LDEKVDGVQPEHNVFLCVRFGCVSHDKSLFLVLKALHISQFLYGTHECLVFGPSSKFYSVTLALVSFLAPSSIEVQKMKEEIGFVSGGFDKNHLRLSA